LPAKRKAINDLPGINLLKISELLVAARYTMRREDQQRSTHCTFNYEYTVVGPHALPAKRKETNDKSGINLLKFQSCWSPHVSTMRQEDQQRSTHCTWNHRNTVVGPHALPAERKETNDKPRINLLKLQSCWSPHVTQCGVRTNSALSFLSHFHGLIWLCF